MEGKQERSLKLVLHGSRPAFLPRKNGFAKGSAILLRSRAGGRILSNRLIGAVRSSIRANRSKNERMRRECINRVLDLRLNQIRILICTVKTCHIGITLTTQPNGYIVSRRIVKSPRIGNRLTIARSTR